MFYQIIFSSLLCVGISATCLQEEHGSIRWNGSGPRLSGPDITNQALEWIENACRGDQGMFTGFFNPGQTKAMCPSTRDGMGWRQASFVVQNLNRNEGFDLGDDDCVNRLKSQVLDCEYGGEIEIAGWRFRADPSGC